MKKLSVVLMILFLISCFNQKNKKSVKTFPTDFNGSVYEVERLDFPYSHISILRMKNLVYDQKYKGYNSNIPYFYFLNDSSAEIMTATNYDIKINDIVKYNSNTNELNFFRNGNRLNLSPPLSYHESALQYYKNKQVKGK